MLKQFGGSQVLGFKLPQAAASHWKSLLESLLSDLADHNSNIILLWDELPWMLQKIAKNHGDSVVIDLLDTLRALRQSHASLRMIYTGSIGLHHVTNALKEQGYNNSPINDMQIIDLPTLSKPDAIQLTQRLFIGEQLQTDNNEQCWAAVAEHSDNVPYYIHHIVAQLTQLAQPITTDTINQTVQQALVDAQDPWQLSHYRSRLKSYYQALAPIAQTILDIFAETQPLTMPALHQELQTSLLPRGEVATNIIEGDSAPLRDLLKTLQRDHYLQLDPQTLTYTFRFPLIRRWWRLELGLI
jgi:hypothetical protein